ESAHDHHDVRYLFAAVGSERLTVSSESHAVRWATPEELLQLTNEESVLRMLRKARPLMESV
ncbi:MAG: NUDIX hydrolase, partial [Planctomycetota bacterium]